MKCILAEYQQEDCIENCDLICEHNKTTKILISQSKVYDRIASALSKFKVVEKCGGLNALNKGVMIIHPDNCPCKGTGKIERPLKPEDVDWENLEYLDLDDILGVKYIKIPATTIEGKEIK